MLLSGECFYIILITNLKNKKKPTPSPPFFSTLSLGVKKKIAQMRPISLQFQFAFLKIKCLVTSFVHRWRHYCGLFALFFHYSANICKEDISRDFISGCLRKKAKLNKKRNTRFIANYLSLRT